MIVRNTGLIFGEQFGKTGIYCYMAVLVPDHCDKASIAIKRVTQMSGFPMHVKVMFMLYGALLNVH